MLIGLFVCGDSGGGRLAHGPDLHTEAERVSCHADALWQTEGIVSISAVSDEVHSRFSMPVDFWDVGQVERGFKRFLPIWCHYFGTEWETNAIWAFCSILINRVLVP